MNRKAIGVLAAFVLGGPCVMATLPAYAGEEDMKVVGSTQQPQQAPRAARGGTEIRSVVVRYGDLDLADTSGIETLYGRLEVASRQVCSPREDARSLALAAHWKQCYAGALDEAVARVGDLRVSQLHRTRTGRDVTRDAQLAGTR